MVNHQRIFIKHYWVSLTLFFLTMVSTVIFDLSIAIVIGIIGGSIFFLIKSAAITISLNELIGNE
ncbi:hypothetical protein L3X09_13580 [Enterococcus faecium]|nr:hypothetical protein [Enterococcus faecium]